MEQMTINILGTDYEVIKETEKENPKLRKASGICEYYDKKIHLCDYQENEETFDNLQAFKNRTFRHEIIHAFFAESGLGGNSDYAENEELVDWIAFQLPKMAKVFTELGIMD